MKQARALFVHCTLMERSVRSSFVRLRGSRRAAPGRGSCGGGRRVQRLRCGARTFGPSPNSLRSLRSLPSNRRRQVSLRGALRARAESPPLLTAPEIATAGYRPPRARRGFVFRGNTPDGSAKARPGRWQRASEALRNGGLSARARSAPRRLTCRHLSERRERSERSEFGDGPKVRVPEGSRCTQQPPQRSADACPGAPLPRSLSLNAFASMKRACCSSRSARSALDH
jgi:hypothetical protein